MSFWPTSWQTDTAHAKLSRESVTWCAKTEASRSYPMQEILQDLLRLVRADALARKLTITKD